MSQPTDTEDFQDPIEDYESPTFDDPIEQALHDEPVAAIQSQPHTSINADTTVRDTLKHMVGDHIACVMVEENGKLVGVFSDRDVLDKVALEYASVIDKPIRNVMTKDPVYVEQTDPAAAALAVVAVSGYRHVPIVDAERNIVGIVSPQRITKFLEERFGNA